MVLLQIGIDLSLAVGKTLTAFSLLSVLLLIIYLKKHNCVKNKCFLTKKWMNGL